MAHTYTVGAPAIQTLSDYLASGQTQQSSSLAPVRIDLSQVSVPGGGPVPPTNTTATTTSFSLQQTSFSSQIPSHSAMHSSSQEVLPVQAYSGNHASKRALRPELLRDITRFRRSRLRHVAWPVLKCSELTSLKPFGSIGWPRSVLDAIVSRPPRLRSVPWPRDRSLSEVLGADYIFPLYETQRSSFLAGKPMAVAHASVFSRDRDYEHGRPASFVDKIKDTLGVTNTGPALPRADLFSRDRDANYGHDMSTLDKIKDKLGVHNEGPHKVVAPETYTAADMAPSADLLSRDRNTNYGRPPTLSDRVKDRLGVSNLGPQKDMSGETISTVDTTKSEETKSTGVLNTIKQKLGWSKKADYSYARSEEQPVNYSAAHTSFVETGKSKIGLGSASSSSTSADLSSAAPSSYDTVGAASALRPLVSGSSVPTAAVMSHDRDANYTGKPSVTDKIKDTLGVANSGPQKAYLSATSLQSERSLPISSPSLSTTSTLGSDTNITAFTPDVPLEVGTNTSIYDQLASRTGLSGSTLPVSTSTLATTSVSRISEKHDSRYVPVEQTPGKIFSAPDEKTVTVVPLNETELEGVPKVNLADPTLHKKLDSVDVDDSDELEAGETTI